MQDTLFYELKSYWENIIQKGESSPQTERNLLEQLTLLKFAENKRIFFSIFNFADFKKEYSTSNTFEVFGIPPEVYEECGTELFFSSIDTEHSQSMLANNIHLKGYLEEMQKEKDVLTFMFLDCGFKFHHGEKGIIRLLRKNNIFETNAKNQPIRSLSMFQDVTHLMKGDFYWFRGVFSSSERTYYMSYRSDTNEFSKKDILSEREKEILKYMAEGKQPEDIAKILFISKTTINNHRQNMLNKLGAKDSTALIQLAKLTNLL